MEALNPWIRANLHTPDIYTEAVIPEGCKNRYQAILQEMGEAGLALSQAHALVYEAQERYALAEAHRVELLEGLVYG